MAVGGRESELPPFLVGMEATPTGAGRLSAVVEDRVLAPAKVEVGRGGGAIGVLLIACTGRGFGRSDCREQSATCDDDDAL